MATGRRYLPVAATVLLAGACMPAAATEQARRTSDLYAVFMTVAAVVAVIVWSLVTWAIVRYRKRSDELPSQFDRHVGLEVLWTAVPLLIVIGLFAMTLSALAQVDGRMTNPAVRVDVTGFRWQWQFDYPDAGVSVVGTADQPAVMVIPVGQAVHLEITSADVVHSFYVPRFLFKRDAVPGRTTSFDLTVAEAGDYAGQCAEFCGVFHDRMTLVVRAVSTADFDAWLAAQKAGTALPSGRATASPTGTP